MKQLSLLFALLLVMGSTLQAQEVMEVTTPVITKKTATWCVNCGTWGWDLFEGLVAQNQNDVVLMAAHFGGSQLENATSTAFVSNLGGAGQPRFYVNNDQQSVNSGNAIASIGTISDLAATIAMEAPVANTGMIGTLDGTMLNVDAKVKFFQEADGEFYLGVYILENNFMFTQTGQSGTVPHKYILQDKITADAFGDEIVNGAVAVGDEFTFNYTTDLADYDTANVSIAAIIYEKNGAFYDIVNAWQIKEFEVEEEEPNSVTEASTIKEMSLAPNPVVDATTLNFQLVEAGTVEIQLFNQAGQVVWSQRTQGLTGTNTVVIQPANQLPAGAYTVQLIHQGKAAQKALIWQ